MASGNKIATKKTATKKDLIASIESEYRWRLTMTRRSAKNTGWGSFETKKQSFAMVSVDYLARRAGLDVDAIADSITEEDLNF